MITATINVDIAKTPFSIACMSVKFAARLDNRAEAARASNPRRAQQQTGFAPAKLPSRIRVR
ncbi:MAG: hypothetical protein ACK53L_04090, partial [Pirellulaceae bacterium]